MTDDTEFGSPRVYPALSWEEWKGILGGAPRMPRHRFDHAEFVTSGENEKTLEAYPYLDHRFDDPDGRDRHAAAAILLEGQPFGFNKYDVELLRLVAKQQVEAEGESYLEPIAARIEALLPPAELLPS